MKTYNETPRRIDCSRGLPVQRGFSYAGVRGKGLNRRVSSTSYLRTPNQIRGRGRSLPISATPALFTFNFDRARVPVARTGPFDATATWAARCPLSPPEFRVNTVSDRGQESHRARSDNSSGGGCKRIMLRPLLESQGRGIAHNCEREVI